MKVLVTGGCGLIGFNIAKSYLQDGHEVIVMDNLERSSLLGHDDASYQRKNFNKKLLLEMGATVFPYDISEAKSFLWMEGLDAIFHMAAQCGVPTSIRNPRRDWEVNADGTLNVLECARKTGAKVVYASTNKVYPLHGGWKLDDALHNPRWRWIDDDWHSLGFPLDGHVQYPEWAAGARTPYGASKYAGDLLCQEYYHTYGVQTGVFRMSCIYGPNQFGFEEQGWATWFIIANLKRWPIKVFGDGFQVRDMLHVSDLVKAYRSFAEGSVEHGVWNMGGGPNNAISLVECIDQIEGLTGIDFTEVEYEDWRPLDQRIYTTNIGQVSKDLNWLPTVYPRMGLDMVINWVADNLEVF